MQIADEQTLEIKEVSDLVTVMDQPDTPENLALATRGFRHGRAGMIAERDKGTQHRYASPPTTNLANPAVAIVGGFTLYDKDANADYEIVAGVDSASNLHLWVYDGAWIELTAIITAQVDTIAGGAGVYTATLKNVQKDGRAYTPTGNELAGYIAVHASTIAANCYSGVPIAAANGVNITATCTPLGTDGGEWVANDSLTLYASTAIREWVAANGANPSLRWMATEAQRKVSLAYGDSSTPVGAHYPVRIMRHGQRKYFYTAAATALMTLPSATGDKWYCEKGGGLETGYHDLGLYINDENYRIMDISEWLEIGVQSTKTPYVTNPNVYCQFYITVQYGHQESDPVGRYGVGYNQVSDISTLFRFYLNPAFMPKDVTGFNIYRSRKVVDPTLPLATQILLRTSSIEEFRLAKFIDITKYDAGVAWALIPTGPFGVTEFAATYTLEGQYTSTYLTEDETNDNIFSTLGHAIATERTRLKPRYMTRAGRDQGTIIAADKSDTEVIFTTVNGMVIHNEDNFVDRSTDNLGNPQKAFLNGHGELLGLGMLSMNLLAFRRGEIEVFDCQSGTHDTIPADVASKQSILQVSSPRGIAWAGTAGLYFLPEDGGGQQLLNPRWINLYNGDLKLPGTDTPYVTDAYREAIITGYDPFYNDLWFQIQVNKAGGGTEYLQFRFQLDQKRWWCVRKLNIGGATPYPAKYFSARKDKTFTIGYASGLLQYPMQSGTLQYEDDVTSAGVTANRGIECDLTLELGSLYSISKKNVLTRLKLDHVGASVDALGTYNLDVYANNETSSIFATQKSAPIDTRCAQRTMQRRGRLESVRLRVSLPTGTLTNFKRFDISTITVSFVKRNMIGRR